MGAENWTQVICKSNEVSLSTSVPDNFINNQPFYAYFTLVSFLPVYLECFESWFNWNLYVTPSYHNFDA